MRIAFLGTGAMGGALVRGVVESGFRPAEDILAFDPDTSRLEALQRETGIRACRDAASAVREAGTVVLCVKPALACPLARELAPEMGPDRLLISIAAGVRIADLRSALPDGAAVIRAMPNTPATIRRAATAICAGEGVTREQLELAEGLFGSVGITVIVEERLMDAVTGLSGSGPAFIFTVIEALADGGVSQGLPRDVALKLAAQTCAGAADLVMRSGQHPAQLRDQVASPGGTTIAGIAELERGGLRPALIGAVQAAARRAKELSEQ